MTFNYRPSVIDIRAKVDSHMQHPPCLFVNLFTLLLSGIHTEVSTDFRVPFVFSSELLLTSLKSVFLLDFIDQMIQGFFCE